VEVGTAHAILYGVVQSSASHSAPPRIPSVIQEQEQEQRALASGQGAPYCYSAPGSTARLVLRRTPVPSSRHCPVNVASIAALLRAAGSGHDPAIRRLPPSWPPLFKWSPPAPLPIAWSAPPCARATGARFPTCPMAPPSSCPPATRSPVARAPPGSPPRRLPPVDR